MELGEASIIERLRAAQGDQRLLAIDGLGGAGKSTVARRLQKALERVTVVEVDDFYRPMPEEERRSMSPEEGYRRLFDWERLRDEVLNPLSLHRPSRYRRYDWTRGCLESTPVNVRPGGVIIVEGVYTQRPELRSYWNLSVFVDLPRDVRRARLLDRGENTPAQIDRWMAAEDYYASSFAPADLADIVISGESLG